MSPEVRRGYAELCRCAHTRSHGYAADRTLLVNSVDHKAQNRNSSTDDVGPDRLETQKKS